MYYDSHNRIVKLCVKGMMLEGEGRRTEAAAIFNQAWNQAENDVERYISAHYVARHQDTPEEKLRWNKTALDCALKVKDEGIRGVLPSLYLNLGRDFESLKDIPSAVECYRTAESYAQYLEDDGYGKMIRGGIGAAIERTGNA